MLKWVQKQSKRLNKFINKTRGFIILHSYITKDAGKFVYVAFELSLRIFHTFH